MTGWRSDPVPLAWRGLWRRLALQRADGSADIESFVVWLQADRLFADLRLPPPDEALTGVRGFADLTPAAARRIASQEGFAGTLLWNGDRCRWQRRIDFAPAAGPADEGQLTRAGRMLVETGLHVNYIEHWWQALDIAPRFMRPGVVSSPGRRVLIRAEQHFMVAEDRRPRPPAPGRLCAAVEEALSDKEALRRLLDCEISYGVIEPNSHGADVWRIERSTLPWRCGKLLSPDELPG